MAPDVSLLVAAAREGVRRVSEVRRRSLVATLVATLSAVPAAVPRGAGFAAQPAPSVEYLSFVQAFRENGADSVVEGLSEKDDAWVRAAVDGVVRQAARWPTTTTESAVLLHTTAVVSGWVLPAHAAVHLDAARRFVDAPRDAPVSREFRCKWLLLLAWHYQGEMALGDALPWLDELRLGCASDGEAQLAFGTFYESLAARSGLPEDLPWSGRSRTLAVLKRRTAREALNAAVPALEAARRVAATEVAATVRLAHVLSALDQAGAARQYLQPLLDSRVDRRWRYLAALFLAEAEARAGDRHAAEAAYLRAAGVMPGCQTPLFGVLSLRQTAGDSVAASDIALQLATRDVVCEDPWWFYRPASLQIGSVPSWESCEGG